MGERLKVIGEKLKGKVGRDSNITYFGFFATRGIGIKHKVSEAAI